MGNEYGVLEMEFTLIDLLSNTYAKPAGFRPDLLGLGLASPPKACTGRTAPDNASSPRHSTLSSAAWVNCPLAANKPSAIARSKRPPSLGRSAGARLRVIRRWGNSSRELTIALRTRSLLSLTVASGNPTRVRVGRPLARWASIRTGGASTPTWARLWTMARDMNTP